MGMPPGANSPLLSPPKRPARSWALSVCVSTAYPLTVDLAGTRLGKLVPDEYLLGYHVGWPVLYYVLPDPVHGPLLGAKAVALVLYHGVLASEEVQIPLLVPFDGIPRVDDPLDVEQLRRGEGIRAVSPTCGLLVAPVAHRHGRAPVDEFARLPRGSSLALFGYHHDLGVRYRLADAITLLGGGTVDLFGREVRRTERFREPVHKEYPGPRRLEQSPELVEVGLGYASSCVGQVAQVRKGILPYRPGAPDQERPQGRYARQAGDLVPPERLKEVPGQSGTEQVQRRAGPEGSRELAHPRVEVEGERREDPILQRIAQVRGDDLGPHDHVALTRRDALGHTRGPRGVEYGSEVRLGDLPVLPEAFTIQGLGDINVGSGGVSLRPRTPVEGGLNGLRP